MKLSIDINNRRQLHDLLMQLKPDAQPLWGKMTARQMVEHLVNQVEWTNGTRIPTCDVLPEEASRSKQIMIYTDAQIPQNVFVAHLPEQYTYASLPEAIHQLMEALKLFDEHFKKPGITVIHGGFGPMTHQEWIIWHGKHFAHHLRQFGVLLAKF